MATRFFTDPKSGASYAFGDKLPSSDFNSWIGGIRVFDAAFERITCSNWERTGTAASSLGVDALAADASLPRALLICGDSGGNPVIQYLGNGEYASRIDGAWTAATVPAGVGLTALVAVGSGAGIYVVGGVPGSSSAARYRESTDGSTWASRNGAAAGTYGVTGLAYDATNGVFVSGLDGATASTTIETSPDGQTWTARTTANTNRIKDVASGGGVTIAVSDAAATTNKALRSTDGTTWSTEVTLPRTTEWTAVGYAASSGVWLASNSGGTRSFAKSTDGGITWSDVVSNVDGVEHAIRLVSTGNYWIMASENVLASDSGVWVSFDDGVTWSKVKRVNTGNPVNDVLYTDGLAVAAVGTASLYGTIQVTGS